MEVKNPKSFSEQLEKIKSRGCRVEDEAAAIDFLHTINYYRLTAYFLPFRGEDCLYKDGTTFENICAIYEFDRKMRNIVFSAVEEIELMLRTQLAYFHARKYGALGYLSKENFGSLHKHDIFLDHINHAIESNKNLLFVKHHIKKYGRQFPTWVIIELFTMGELSFFYSDMHRADKKEFAKTVFGVNDSNLSSWLICLTYIRNYCAHYSRLYYFLFPAIPSTPIGLDYTLGKKLFDYLMILKFLYRDKNKWNAATMVNLNALIEEYWESIQLEHIGFPKNWNDMLKYEVPKDIDLC